MALSMGQIRDLGFKKVISIFENVALRQGYTYDDLVSSLERGIVAFYDIKIPPFGALRYYDSIKILSTEEVGGLVELMRLSAVDIDIVKAERESKQIFKYNWSQLWVSFMNSGTRLTKRFKDYHDLSGLALALPLFLSAVEACDPVSEKIMSRCKFYVRKKEALAMLSTSKESSTDLSYKDVRLLTVFFNLLEYWYCTTKRLSADADTLLTALVLMDGWKFANTLLSGGDFLLCQ